MSVRESECLSLGMHDDNVEMISSLCGLIVELVKENKLVMGSFIHIASKSVRGDGTWSLTKE